MSHFIQLGPDGVDDRRPALPWSQRLALGAVALGATLLVILGSTPSTLQQLNQLPGIAWLPMAGTLGLIGVGLTTWFTLRYVGTPRGIRNDGVMTDSLTSQGWMAWCAGVSLTAFYVCVYWVPWALEGPVRLLDKLSWTLTGADADVWFLYGTVYTLAVLVFATRMVWRYRHVRYQILRTLSVSFFQLGFAWLVPALLKRLHQPEYYATYFWPLKPEYAYPPPQNALLGNGTIGWILLAISAAMILVVTPTLTYFFGKRWYCSWVCGCGGLAETVGDPWRHLSDTSLRAWKLERWTVHGVLVLIVLTTGILWADWMLTEGGVSYLGGVSSTAKSTYGFVIGAMFSGVVGVGFYPLLGSRVWCRFGCPMAALLGLQQRFFSRFRITTNGGQCISCGNCSTYCEMGIDVRAYAQRGENIVRASCVGCGICSAVCPRGVLRLENGPHGDRYEGAAAPFAALLDSLGVAPLERAPPEDEDPFAPRNPSG